MNCYEILAANLKLLRLYNNETQYEIASKIGISRSNLARYEMGKNVPPLDVMISLADYFGISLDDLLRNEKYNPEDFE